MFFQDDWHLNRRLTLNLGIRWDYAGPEHEKYNRLLNGFCFTCSSPGTAGTYVNSLGTTVAGPALLGGPTFAGAGGAPSGITNPKYDNFGPRVGFAYDMGHDMVLRGGWGVIYGQQMIELGAAPGFSGTTSLVSQPSFPGVFNPNISFANPIQTGLSPSWVRLRFGYEYRGSHQLHRSQHRYPANHAIFVGDPRSGWGKTGCLAWPMWVPKPTV